MKIEVEVSDEKARILEEELDLDAEKLVHNMVEGMVNHLVEIALSLNVGVPVSLDDARKIGEELGHAIMKSSKKKVDTNESS